MKTKKANKTKNELPFILNKKEVHSIFSYIENETHMLIVSLLYEAGLRLMECITLRIKDINFIQNNIIVRNKFGKKNRMIPIPVAVFSAFNDHITNLKLNYKEYLKKTFGGVYSAYTFNQYFPTAVLEEEWLYLFQSKKSYNRFAHFSHNTHIEPNTIQRIIKEASQKAKINVPAGCHTLRHSAAVHLLQEGISIKKIQSLMNLNDHSILDYYQKIAFASK